jgi:outer membrane protein W
MKKTILLLVAVAFGFTSFAQKPSEGNLLTEANFSLNQWNNEFSLPNLRFRYFLADDLALRVDLSLTGSSEENNFGTTDASGTQEISNSGFGMRVGAEKHWGGNDKFSPFASAMIGFGSNSRTETWTNYDGNGYADGFNAEVESGGSNFGIVLAIGADYWITESFYMGTEFGWGWGSNTVDDGTATVNGTTSTTLGGSSSGFGEGMANAGFRVGFVLK